MRESQLLREATVQEIQLELLRRTQFNEMRGDRVAAKLMRHRHLWQAVLLDRLGVPDSRDRGGLPAMSLIKLRDLPGNHWNADTLFILTSTPVKARELARIIEDADWAGEVEVHENREEIGMALGVGGREYGLLSVWWD